MNAHILIFPLDYIPHYVGTPTQSYGEAELLNILYILNDKGEMREKVYRNQLWLRGKNKREPLSALRATTKERREGLQLKLKEMEG